MSKRQEGQAERPQGKREGAVHHVVVIDAYYHPDGHKEFGVSSPTNADIAILVELLQDSLAKMNSVLIQELVELRKQNHGSAGAEPKSRIVEPTTAERAVLG